MILCSIKFCKGTEIVSSIDDYLLSSMTQQHANIIDFKEETYRPEYVENVKEDDSFPIIYSGIGQIYSYVFDKPL